MDEFLFGSINYNPQQLANIKEMERRANDRIRVFNPLDEDFTTGWDGTAFTVPNRNKDMGFGKGQRVLPRYIAINFLEGMANLIMGQRRNAAVAAENMRRRSSGQLPMTKYEEEHNYIISLGIDTRMEKMKVWRILWLGVEEEWGFNEVAQRQEEIITAEEKAFRLEMERSAKQLDPNELPTLNYTAPTAVNPTQTFNADAVPQAAQAPVAPATPEAPAQSAEPAPPAPPAPPLPQGLDPKDQVLQDVAR